MSGEWFPYGQREMEYLQAADPQLGRVIRCWGKVERPVITDLFAGLVQALIGQLISVKAAQTVWQRLLTQSGGITATALADLTPAAIQGCGMTQRKAGYIHQLAVDVRNGTLALDELRQLDDAAAIKRLSCLPGIGSWTAEMLLLHSLLRPDIISWGDLGIRRGMMLLYDVPDLNQAEFQAYRMRYAPYGSVASIYLWRIFAEGGVPDHARR